VIWELILDGAAVIGATLVAASLLITGALELLGEG
jgi:hypothetical protein